MIVLNSRNRIWAYTEATLKKLFALSGNQCAFPSCLAPIVDDDSGIIVGEICHIAGKSPNGPRYDRSQSDAERNGYDNLLHMCNPHNKIVDHRDTRDQYPPERLRQFKRDHEVKFRRKLFDPTWADNLNLRRVDQRQMLAFVNHFFPSRTVTHVFEPLIADWQFEEFESRQAKRTRTHRVAITIRYYGAYLHALYLSKIHEWFGK
jgi:hypothetical protein